MIATSLPGNTSGATARNIFTRSSPGGIRADIEDTAIPRVRFA
jgi:hypothetical protein